MENFNFFYVLSTKRMVYAKHKDVEAIDLSYAREQLFYYLKQKYKAWTHIMIRYDDIDYILEPLSPVMTKVSEYFGKINN